MNAEGLAVLVIMLLPLLASLAELAYPPTCAACGMELELIMCPGFGRKSLCRCGHENGR